MMHAQETDMPAAGRRGENGWEWDNGAVGRFRMEKDLDVWVVRVADWAGPEPVEVGPERVLEVIGRVLAGVCAAELPVWMRRQDLDYWSWAAVVRLPCEGVVTVRVLWAVDETPGASMPAEWARKDELTVPELFRVLSEAAMQLPAVDARWWVRDDDGAWKLVGVEPRGWKRKAVPAAVEPGAVEWMAAAGKVNAAAWAVRDFSAGVWRGAGGWNRTAEFPPALRRPEVERVAAEAVGFLARVWAAWGRLLAAVAAGMAEPGGYWECLLPGLQDDEPTEAGGRELVASYMATERAVGDVWLAAAGVALWDVVAGAPEFLVSVVEYKWRTMPADEGWESGWGARECYSLTFKFRRIGSERGVA